MERLFERLSLFKKTSTLEDVNSKEHLEKHINVLYGMLGNVYGSKNVVEMASRYKVLDGLQSKNSNERVHALLTIVEQDITIKKIESDKELLDGIDRIESKLAEILSVKSIEAEVNKKVTKLMEEKHKEYLKELKKKIVSDEIGPETEHTEKKHENLKKLNEKGSLKTVMEILRPKSLDEIVGQEKAIKALFTKVGTPFPQHVILYGPPGVGKTTAARLILNEAKKLSYSSFEEESPFIEIDGTTLRWDPRDMSNPLTGSVHDPIYQGANRDFAGDGIPEPKLGLVTDAHGGVLFIDEIGEMDIKYQSKLLKVLEDKRVNFESAYYDSENKKVPLYIKELFEKGAPADFILIGATTASPTDINSAIRSRVAEIYFEPLDRSQIKKIVENAASKLNINISDDALDMISEYTIEGRKAVNILADAYSAKLYENHVEDISENDIKIDKDDILKIASINRLTSFFKRKSKDKKEKGRILGLGVSGYIGSIIEFEGIKSEAKEGKGTIRFNDTAGSMAKDSVFNALLVAKQHTGVEIKDLDFHINIIGGGKVDGPSAGAAITTLIISMIEDKEIRQDIAITGEISIRGKIKPVGGVVEKIYGAIQAGVKTVLIPYDNRDEVPNKIDGINIVIVETIDDVLKEVW